MTCSQPWGGAKLIGNAPRACNFKKQKQNQKRLFGFTWWHIKRITEKLRCEMSTPRTSLFRNQVGGSHCKIGVSFDHVCSNRLRLDSDMVYKIVGLRTVLPGQILLATLPSTVQEIRNVAKHEHHFLPIIFSVRGSIFQARLRILRWI